MLDYRAFLIVTSLVLPACDEPQGNEDEGSPMEECPEADEADCEATGSGVNQCSADCACTNCGCEEEECDFGCRIPWYEDRSACLLERGCSADSCYWSCFASCAADELECLHGLAPDTCADPQGVCFMENTACVDDCYAQCPGGAG